MSNAICNIVSFVKTDKSRSSVISILKAIEDDRYGLGTIDFNKAYYSKTHPLVFGFAPYENGSNVIRFITKNTAVNKNIICLSATFSDWIIRYQWADEDFGSNVGEILCYSGKIINQNIPKMYTRNAYLLSSEAWAIYNL